MPASVVEALDLGGGGERCDASRRRSGGSLNVHCCPSVLDSHLEYLRQHPFDVGVVQFDHREFGEREGLEFFGGSSIFTSSPPRG